jgi:hypothetical protein
MSNICQCGKLFEDCEDHNVFKALVEAAKQQERLNEAIQLNMDDTDVEVEPITGLPYMTRQINKMDLIISNTQQGYKKC